MIFADRTWICYFARVGIFWTENSVWYRCGRGFCRFGMRSIGKILLQCAGTGGPVYCNRGKPERWNKQDQGKRKLWNFLFPFFYVCVIMRYTHQNSLGGKYWKQYLLLCSRAVSKKSSDIAEMRWSDRRKVSNLMVPRQRIRRRGGCYDLFLIPNEMIKPE